MSSTIEATGLTAFCPKWDATTIPPDSRELLEKYSGVAPDRVNQHVEELRDKGNAICPYPCIRQLRFLSLNLASQPLYPNILSRLKAGQRLLDVGCCFGQDIRKLVADGAPPEHIYGLDKEADFIDLGHELFQDRGTLRSKFIVADTSDPSADLGELEGKMDVLWVSSFLHLWDWENQLKVAKRLVSLCAPKKGTFIVGRQVASIVAGEYPIPGLKQTQYRHNVESMKELWRQVGDETGSAWEVEGTLYVGREVAENKGQSWVDPVTRFIRFCVTRD